MIHVKEAIEVKEVGDNNTIIDQFAFFVEHTEFPCVAAKAAWSRKQIKFFIAEHMACPKDDRAILDFLYDFTDQFRKAENQFHTACVIFKDTAIYNEVMFDQLLWLRLKALSDLDAINYSGDKRVSGDPSSPNYSFSLKDEAYYVVGLSPVSSRTARRFNYPALVFNAHAQFEHLRTTNTYEKNEKHYPEKRNSIFRIR